MIIIQGWIVDANETSASTLPSIVRLHTKTILHNFLTETYTVRDGRTGDFLYKETGVKIDGKWVIFQNKEE
mgnify:CR=1 FL=1